jgi:hypothetical protein
MAEYQVILDGLSSFGMEVTAPDGFQSVRGFPTEAAALLWIAEQTARNVKPAFLRLAWVPAAISASRRPR